MERPNAWNSYDEGALSRMEELCAEYKSFLDKGKTERECADLTVEMAEAAGYRNLEDVIAKG